MKKKKEKPTLMYLGWDTWSQEFSLQAGNVKYVYRNVSEHYHRRALFALRGRKPNSVWKVLDGSPFRKFDLTTGDEITINLKEKVS